MVHRAWKRVYGLLCDNFQYEREDREKCDRTYNRWIGAVEANAIAKRDGYR